MQEAVREKRCKEGKKDLSAGYRHEIKGEIQRRKNWGAEDTGEAAQHDKVER